MNSNTSIDIVWCEDLGYAHNLHHGVLVANVRAQGQALMMCESDHDGGLRVQNADLDDALRD